MAVTTVLIELIPLIFICPAVPLSHAFPHHPAYQCPATHLKFNGFFIGV